MKMDEDILKMGRRDQSARTRVQTVAETRGLKLIVLIVAEAVIWDHVKLASESTPRITGGMTVIVTTPTALKISGATKTAIVIVEMIMTN